MVRPMNGRLVMEQLRYADEIRDIAEVRSPRRVKKRTDSRLKLIDQAHGGFQPKKYKDTVRASDAGADRAQSGKARDQESGGSPKTKVLDLMQG